MREIKFRGRDGDVWVYGSLIKNRGLPIEIFKENTYFETVAVDPDTVGQFTGLLDSNGDEIYEGDILLFAPPRRLIETARRLGVVVFKDYAFVVKYDDMFTGLFDLVADIEACTIISNVHDNPELLEVKNA